LKDAHEPERRTLLGGAVGFSAGWATITEFPGAIPAVLLALLAMVCVWPHGRRATAMTAVRLAAGALACAGLLMAYQYACFGSPFHVGDASEQAFAALHQGFFGIGVPKLVRLRAILTGQYRGLLLIAPILGLAPGGLAVLVWRRSSRLPAVVAVLIAA
jgi:hypothetical protein